MKDQKLSDRTLRRIKNGLKKYFPELKVTNIEVVNHDHTAIMAHQINYPTPIICIETPECSNFSKPLTND